MEEDQKKVIERKASIKSESSKTAIRIPSLQSATLTMYPYNCSHHKCINCGIEVRWNCLLKNATRFIHQI